MDRDRRREDGSEEGWLDWTSRIWIGGELYMRKWRLLPRGPWPNIELHRIHLPDEGGRGVHAHPYPFVAITLKGAGEEILQRAGESAAFLVPLRRLRWYGGRDRHRITRIDGPAWTLCITGWRTKGWGFHPEPDLILDRREG